MAIIIATGPYWAAPLHSSVSQNSQKSATTEPTLQIACASVLLFAHWRNIWPVAWFQNKQSIKIKKNCCWNFYLIANMKTVNWESALYQLKIVIWKTSIEFRIQVKIKQDIKSKFSTVMKFWFPLLLAQLYFNVHAGYLHWTLALTHTDGPNKLSRCGQSVTGGTLSFWNGSPQPGVRVLSQL